MMNFIFLPLWFFTPIVALLGLALAYKIYNDLLLRADGTDKMREISMAIRDGALSYLRQQAHILVPVIFRSVF